MYRVIAFALIAAVVAVDPEWEAFKSKYKKKYDS
jgi:hypothetical protein